jgi:hypothetical protein
LEREYLDETEKPSHSWYVWIYPVPDISGLKRVFLAITKVPESRVSSSRRPRIHQTG